jgi:hypothetical protein
MTPAFARPLPELELDLVRDAVDERGLSGWDPRYWVYDSESNGVRCATAFRKLGLAWGRAIVRRSAPSGRNHRAVMAGVDEVESERQLAKSHQSTL